MHIGITQYVEPLKQQTNGMHTHNPVCEHKGVSVLWNREVHTEQKCHTKDGREATKIQRAYV